MQRRVIHFPPIWFKPGVGAVRVARRHRRERAAGGAPPRGEQ